MAAPNMATIAASLERSLQNCSLNHTISGGGNGIRSSQGSSVHVGIRRSSSTSSISDDSQQNQFTANNNNEDTTLELNSNVSLPYHWEQCLDLKTGEIYYINWRNGMKAKEDPRTAAQYSGDCYYSDDDDNSSYDSEESSTESSPSSSREREPYNNQQKESDQNNKQDHVLVVAGCKSCLMYYMVPKQHEDCPKCSGQLLHFDRSESGSP
ncbi:protein CURLY FLAG LEAF 1 [Argentina anserina]|uniref:protein CURLY FLAG LEAF 1 n=1 Tax=Argentina anserina TaxID=57926 RepID=UPI002176943C|nr:protein CURLY FLAG LEAF 1 [Potentilla anserina]